MVRNKTAMPSALTYSTLSLPDSKQPLISLTGGVCHAGYPDKKHSNITEVNSPFIFPRQWTAFKLLAGIWEKTFPAPHKTPCIHALSGLPWIPPQASPGEGASEKCSTEGEQTCPNSCQQPVPEHEPLPKPARWAFFPSPMACPLR